MGLFNNTNYSKNIFTMYFKIQENCAHASNTTFIINFKSFRKINNF